VTASDSDGRIDFTSAFVYFAMDAEQGSETPQLEKNIIDDPGEVRILPQGVPETKGQLEVDLVPIDTIPDDPEDPLRGDYFFNILVRLASTRVIAVVPPTTILRVIRIIGTMPSP
jgi:hypothetical protein